MPSIRFPDTEHQKNLHSYLPHATFEAPFVKENQINLQGLLPDHDKQLMGNFQCAKPTCAQGGGLIILGDGFHKLTLQVLYIESVHGVCCLVKSANWLSFFFFFFFHYLALDARSWNRNERNDRG